MASTGLAEPLRRRAGRSGFGCAPQCVCLGLRAPGGSSTSTHQCPFTWMAACGPPLTSGPKLTHRDTRTDRLASGSLLLFLALGDFEREERVRRNFMLKMNYWAVVVAALAAFV